MSRFTISGFSDEIDQDIDIQFSALNKMGISYFEPRGINGTSIADLTDEQLENLKSKMKEYGIKVSSIGSPIGKIGIRDDFEEHLVKLRRVIHIAKELDTKYIRMFSFFMREDKPEDVRDEVMRRMKAMTKVAEEEGVILLHENEKGIYGDIAPRCAEILKEVNSPNLRAVFDFANFVQCGQVTYPDAFELMKPYVKYIHIKDAKFESGDVVPPGEGDGQLETIFKAFPEYEGFLSLEPHLGVFAGLADLEEDDKMLGLEKASEKTFALAYNKLLEIIERV